MKSILIVLNFCVGANNYEPADFCKFLNAIVAKERLETTLRFQNDILGKQNYLAVVYDSKNVRDNFDVGVGDFDCTSQRFLIFSDPEIFAHNVKKVLRFDRIKVRKNKFEITYSIVEWYDDGKLGGFKSRALITKKVLLLKEEEGYK